MENLGDILRRLGDRSLSRTTNGAGANHREPEPAADWTDAAAALCQFCRGSGWVSRRQPVGHPEFGQAVPCRCQQTQDAAARTAALRRYSNLGALGRISFANTSPEGALDDPAARRLFAEALPQAAAYAENPQGWLVFTGPSGSGKTHLAAAIANRCLERQQTIFFILVADLLDHLRSSYAPDSPTGYDELFEQVRNVPLLALDGLGSHSSTPWAQEKLFQVVNHRYNNELPTIVTVRGPLPRLEETLRTRLEGGGGVRSQVLQLGHFNSRLARGIGEIRPEMLRRMTFDRFDPAGNGKASRQDRESLEHALHAARTFAAAPEGWVLFTGDHGCGKTHLSVAIAQESLRQGRQVFFAFVPTLLDHLRATFSPDSAIAFDELFEQLNTVPLLILDDLGAESSTPWAEDKLYQIVVHRYEARLPTIITTAIDLDHLAEAKPRIAARLVDGMVVDWQPITAPNYRDMRRA